MRNDISLGVFAPGQSKNLTIQLQLDPAMGNEYQGLMGLIKWVWSAQDKTTPFQQPVVIINGAKTWHHGSLPVSQRPASLTILVKANDQIITTQNVTADDHWKWSFTLPKYDDQGKEIKYVIDEAPLPGYTTTINGADVTNTHATHGDVTISGTKSWYHGSNANKRPESITVHIMRGSETVASKRVTAADNWSYSFTLPKYAPDGSEAKYTITEDPVPYYSLAGQSGYNLLNEFKGLNYPGDPPKTGDDSDLVLWASMMGASAVLFAITLVWGWKSKKKQAA
jgi:uncharacterized protein YxeA